MVECSMNNTFNKKIVDSAWQTILDARSIVLLGHKNPDGDAISSCAAMERILLQLEGKEVESIFPNKPALDVLESPIRMAIDAHSFVPDLIISCDTANYDRLYFPDAFANAIHINIDHHVSSSITPTYNFLDANASSTAEVIYNLLQQWNPKILSTHVANALLYGILSDTQVFHIPTSAATMRAAAHLVDCGADFEGIKRSLLCHKDAHVIKLWGHVLSNIIFTSSRNVAIALITQHDFATFNLTASSLVGFINFLNEIAGIDVGVLLYEIELGKTKVSLRSKSYDVNALAGTLGGGGHIRAAGIFLDMPPQDALEKMRPLLEEI
jgi:phosphoesterase RecJ-like protein